MTKRFKPAVVVPAIKSLEEADSILARIAAQKRSINLIEAGMNDDIDIIKVKAAEQAEPYRQEVMALEQALARYADYNKTELFKAKKSLDMTFGSIGFRASSKLKLLSKWSWERVLESLRDTKITGCIRIKEEPDKEALKGLDPEHLKRLGCKVVQEDAFFYELAEQELGETGTGAP